MVGDASQCREPGGNEFYSTLLSFLLFDKIGKWVETRNTRKFQVPYLENE